MLRSLIPPIAYIDQDWFEKERKLLFEPLWQFATLKTLLKTPNAYVALNILGREVVIQKFDGQLHAFLNICLHRQNQLQANGIGSRPLVCKYHGWAYNENGKVSNIPHQKECYQIEVDSIECLHLKQFPLKILGNLIFINLSNTPIEFDAQFSIELQNQLIELSESFDDEVLVTHLPIEANWKLCYENLRDSLHPSFLHRNSLAKHVDFKVNFDARRVESLKNIIASKLSAEDFLEQLKKFSSGGLNEPLIAPKKFRWHEFVHRYNADDWYLNWLIFPNFHISSGSGGYSFIIEHHRPISAKETELALYICTAKRRRKYKYSAAVLYAHLEGALQTLGEDFQVVENIQSVLRSDSDHSINGNFELENTLISKWYMAVLDGTHAL